MCRAYNRWLADYCKPYPERLFAVAMLPMQSVELAIDELCYARNQLGMRSGFIRPNPYNNRMLNDSAYNPLWAEAQELDFAIGVHEGTGGMPATGTDLFLPRPVGIRKPGSLASRGKPRRSHGGRKMRLRRGCGGAATDGFHLRDHGNSAKGLG